MKNQTVRTLKTQLRRTTMLPKDVIGLINYCSDHVIHFNAWPVEYFEWAGDGTVWEMDAYLKHLTENVPAFVSLMLLHMENNEDHVWQCAECDFTYSEQQLSNHCGECGCDEFNPVSYLEENDDDK